MTKLPVPKCGLSLVKIAHYFASPPLPRKYREIPSSVSCKISVLEHAIFIELKYFIFRMESAIGIKGKASFNLSHPI